MERKSERLLRSIDKNITEEQQNMQLDMLQQIAFNTEDGLQSWTLVINNETVAL